jgi:hypothetical protein
MSPIPHCNHMLLEFISIRVLRILSCVPNESISYMCVLHMVWFVGIPFEFL